MVTSPVLPGDAATPAGRLTGIARRPRPRALMEELAAGVLSRDSGLAGDARGQPGPRQVTVLAEEGWSAAMAALEVSLPWTARRANLRIRGLDLQGTTGRQLRIGATAVLLITGELEPCRWMDAAHPGLRGALRPDWRGGVTGRILVPGPIAVGDPVVLAAPP